MSQERILTQIRKRQAAVASAAYGGHLGIKKGGIGVDKYYFWDINFE